VAGQPFDYEPDPLPADAPFTLAAPAHWDERINGIEWFDITANRKIDPKTDVALSGHAYSLTVFLTAKPGSCFATDDAGYPCISATLSDTAVTDVGSLYGEDPETYNCLIKYLSVAGEHLLEVKNGTAYNDLGDNIMLEIGAAAPGTVVTLVAKEKPGMGFYGWYCSNEDVEFADAQAITTTFVMPDSDISVFAEFDEATPVTVISVMELDEPVPFGKPDYTASIVSDGVAFYGDDRIDGCLNGITWYDHDLSETLDPETDTFIPGHSYTAIVHMKTQTGYYFPVNDEGWYDGIIACINEQEISYSMADETTTHREINLLYDFTVPMAYTLDIIGGTAYRYSEAVTWAEEGDGITIEADKRADAFFIRWEVVSGDAEIIDPNSPMTRFIMPGGDVQIKAVFQSKYLDQVVINQTVEHQTGNILYWDAVEEATAYVICRKQFLLWEEIATTGGLGYKDTTAEPGVRYSYQVYATDGTRTGPKSDAVSMTRPKPPAITHLDNVTITKVIGHTTGNILYWDAVKNADLYQIYRLYSGEGTWTLLKNTRSLGFKDESAKVGVKAYYKIVARNGNVMSDIKSTFSVGVVRPGVPRLDNVVIVKTLGHSTGNIIYWNAVEGAKIYQVYRMRYGDAGWTLLKNTGSLAYKDTTAESGVKYYYKIVARNGDIKSDIKTTASASVTRP
jgi:fibronectin type 3 domain-containing protein